MSDSTEIAPGKPCPLCGRPSTQAFRPFCSKRCADIDLHRWLSGTYVIPGPAPDEADDNPNLPRRDDRPEE